MFTGIIKFLGTLKTLSKKNDRDLLIEIDIENNKNNPLPSLEIGCSISCNGACLTLIEKISKEDKSITLKFEASAETISKTNIKNWQIKDLINIEPSLKIGDELGGHLVSGHVDGLCEVKSISKKNSSYIFTFSKPSEFKKFISQKGSIVLNGVSLTINEVNTDSFVINIIDHTIKKTNFQNTKIGDQINLEIDMIARYLDNLTNYDQ